MFLSNSRKWLFHLISIKGRTFVLLILVCLLINNGNAQSRIEVKDFELIKATKEIVRLDKNDKITKSKLKQVQSRILDFFSNDPNFIVIDRKSLSDVREELELQAGEGFENGYSVEQGKFVGVDMICTGHFNEDERTLTIEITEVSTSKILGTVTRKVKSLIIDGYFSLLDDVNFMLFKLTTNSFDQKYLIVKTLKSKKGNAQEVLVFINNHSTIFKAGSFDIMQKVEETINNETVFRKEKIGTGTTLRTDDENFMVLKVKLGKKRVYDALKNEIELECQLVY